KQIKDSDPFNELLLSVPALAFRGHGLSLLVRFATCWVSRLMHLPLRFRCRKTSAIPAGVEHLHSKQQ
ncbi:hypothetical protein ACFVR1_07440, partial [Psychrobacillus sp. NPDC058041]|uniref:hypothetical protein n=1 Tax=Psychrobacillus sp. NPDC058041 TaxID=3346310 RepID=UPI0036D7CE66